jgi:hypothetical protein
MERLSEMAVRVCLAVLMAGFFSVSAMAQTNATSHPAAPMARPAALPRVRKIRAMDADNHNVLLNRPGMVSVILGTSEDSQNPARQAGKAMYPFQGRPDFQLIVVVDLRDSLATWAPSIVISRMRSSLDQEAIELKPYFLKNGNKSNPRYSSYVIPDFSGTICPQLGWLDSSDQLRGILFGVDGREIKRWDKIDDMNKFEADVRAAIEPLITADLAKAAAVAKTQGTKLIQPSSAHPPLLPPISVDNSD